MNILERLIIRPIITEKSLGLADTMNQVTFEVKKAANKIEIAKAIEKKFGVTVEKVRMVNLRGKKIRYGKKREITHRSPKRKAIVTLKKGDKIGLFELK